MRRLKVLAIAGFIIALTGWSVEPALEETQPVIPPVQTINITCKEDYITIEPLSFQLSQFSKEKARWHFVGSGPNSVSACKVGGGTPLRDLNLKKIEINLKVPGLLSQKYPNLLTLNYPEEPWQEGVDYEIEGEIGEKPLEENEIRIEYSIKFLSGDGKLLLERKGFEVKLVPAIECGVHPGKAKEKDGDYSSIVKALEDKGRQCERIIVEPGDYEENPTIEPRLRPLKIEASGEERKPTIKAEVGREVNQIFFLKQAFNVTIEGLHIRGGNIGILVQRSHNITIRNVKVFDNEEAGIRVVQSGDHGAILLEGIEAYNNGRSQNNREHKGGIVVTSSSQNVTIKNSLVHDNPADGIVITRESKRVMISNNEIRNNEANGIFVKDATVDLISNTIVQNGKNKKQPGCGVRVEGYPPPTDSLVRSNEIIANGPDPDDKYPDKVNNHNICPRELAQTLRKRRIDIPYRLKRGGIVLKTIQDAIHEAEPLQQKDEQPYEVVIEKGNYKENLCIDRSIFIRAIGPVTLRSEKKENPTIVIASGDCSLLEGRSDKPIQIRIQGPFEGSITVDGENKAKPGLQVGTMHSVSTQPVSLQVILQNVTVQNHKETGVKVSPENNRGHSLIVQLSGSTLLQDAACTVSSATKPPTNSQTWIRNNQVGVLVDTTKEALVQLQVENAVISNNSDTGLKLISKRTANSAQPDFKDLQISTSWIIGNTGVGLSVESQETAKPVIEVRDTRLWENRRGGVLLKAASASQLTAHLTNIDIRKNTGFGVEVAGAVHATLKADVPNPEPEDNPVFIHHNCWIGENFGPGVYVHGPASGKPAKVAIEKLFVFRNGFEDEKREKPIKRREIPETKDKVGPDGIFASGLVELTVRNNLIGLYTIAPGIIESLKTGNAGVGILLQDPKKQLTAEITRNDIRSNRKWGVAYVSKGCLEDIPVDYEVRKGEVKVTGSKNNISENGSLLTPDEEKWGHKRQVCPNVAELKNLTNP